jgi:hypothetical protein
MPDGSVVKGAQGNFPFDRNAAPTLRSALLSADAAEARRFEGLVELDLFGAPWLKDDPRCDCSTFRLTRSRPFTRSSHPAFSPATAQALSTQTL